MSDALAACRAPHRAARPDAVDGLWVILHGLWVTAAGRYTGVRCAASPVTLTRRADFGREG
jgi:hypothetical protein